MTRARPSSLSLALLVIAAGMQTACMHWINDIAFMLGITEPQYWWLWAFITVNGACTAWICMQVFGPRLKVREVDRLIELWRAKRREAQDEGSVQGETYAISQVNAYQSIRVAHGLLPLAAPFTETTEHQTAP